MPMYEYACRKCGKQFEKLVKSMNATGSIACPECQSSDTARTLSVFAVAGESSKNAPVPAGGGCRCGGPGPCGMN